MFRVELMPALHGDCIWVEYGEPPATRHVLIDGGPLGAFDSLQARVRRLPEGSRRLELLVITHVDADHIEGAVKLLSQDRLGVEFRDIWFNGWDQLNRPLSGSGPATAARQTWRSPAQGHYLAVRIEGRKEPWNRWFFGRAVMVPDEGLLPPIELDGGLRLTLLSPDAAKLKALRATWLRSIRALGATPEDDEFFRRRLETDSRYRGAAESPRAPDSIAQALAAAARLDSAAANGSSIAFIAEYAGRSCAFLADAHMQVVERAIGRLARRRGAKRLALDAVKLSHHGSAANLTPAFLAAIDCRDFLVSTDGSHFGHPDDAAIECVLENVPSARLHFNYRSERNARWGDEARQRERGYRAFYPAHGAAGISLELAPGEGT